MRSNIFVEYKEVFVESLRPFRILDFRDKTVLWNELLKRDLIILKLILLSDYNRISPKLLKVLHNPPFTQFILRVGALNLEEIRYKNWRFFSILSPLSEELRKKYNVEKFGIYAIMKHYNPVSGLFDPDTPDKIIIKSVSVEEAYKFVQSL
ncbi:hypothetical protein HS5_03210 [Acidianus sp. HS-5]|nr:hypothetical protein HS5_03210 [Acidianus sp. HS-5]